MRRSLRWVQMCKATVMGDLTLTQNIITESELPMGRLIRTTRMKRLLRHSWMLQPRHPGSQLLLWYQTRSVSPGRTTRTMKQVSKFSGKQGLQERIALLQHRDLTQRPPTIAALQMVLYITTRIVRLTRLEMLRFRMKRVALARWIEIA